MKDLSAVEGMSLIVKTVTRWLKAFILAFGIYLVFYGHLTPGGGFAGGVIVACSFILLTLAYGQKQSLKAVSRNVAGEMDSLGALIFLAVAFAGMIAAGPFFANFIETGEAARFKLLSAGLIPLSNIGIGLKVGMSLFLVFTVLSAMHVAVKGGERRMIRRGEADR
jgi:multicomponent Na+:H+ antiporter subunit B